MPRRKKPAHEPNAYEQFADEYFRPSYNREAGRVLFGEYDVLASVVVPGVDANGAPVARGYELEPVTNPRIVSWIDAMMPFDNRERHDKTPLIAALDSNLELLPIVQGWLVDLLARYQLTKRNDVSRTTDYERRVLSLLHRKDDPEAKRELADLMSRRKQLARLIERHTFTLQGRPATPAYTMTDADAELHARFQAADEDAQKYIDQGYGVEKAVDMVAEEYFPSADDEGLRNEFALGLEKYHKGFHTSSRRMAKRREY
jgi:hypothetical protein